MQLVLLVLIVFYASVVELVDTRDLDNLSAQKETFDVELRKFGEPFKMGIPSQAYLFKLR